MEKDIRKELIKILSVRHHVNQDTINDDTELRNDIGMDSLDQVEFVMAVEDEFDISIPDEKIEKIKTFGDLVKFVEQY